MNYRGNHLCAPSNLITSPFNMGFSTMLVTKCANSSGFPSRDGNGVMRFMNSIIFSGKYDTSGVSNTPGTKKNEKVLRW